MVHSPNGYWVRHDGLFTQVSVDGVVPARTRAHGQLRDQQPVAERFGEQLRHALQLWAADAYQVTLTSAGRTDTDGTVKVELRADHGDGSIWFRVALPAIFDADFVPKASNELKASVVSRIGRALHEQVAPIH